MKARIRKTGEIVNLANYVAINSWGNPIELKPEEIELLPDITEDDHWQDVRESAAIAAMQGVMNFFGSIDYNRDTIAELAVEQADALIEELRKQEKTKE